jgi:hypothetical protein
MRVAEWQRALAPHLRFISRTSEPNGRPHRTHFRFFIHTQETHRQFNGTSFFPSLVGFCFPRGTQQCFCGEKAEKVYERGGKNLPPKGGHAKKTHDNEVY